MRSWFQVFKKVIFIYILKKKKKNNSFILNSNEIRKFYPNKYLNYDESRIFVLSTLFNLPETYLLASIINYFTTSEKYEQ
jgi:hypothetical protein